MVGNDTKFTIEEDEVQSHAPIVFESLRIHYRRLKLLGTVVPDPGFINEMIAQSVEMFGVLPDADIEYEKTLLDNEQFRITVIFHLCIMMWLCQEIDWTTYIEYLDILERTIGSSAENKPEQITNQSILLKLFNVSPNVLPKGYVQQASIFDELNLATAFIGDEVEKTRAVNDGFTSYTAYFEYMKEFAVYLTNELHNKGMFGTHAVDRFALILISLRNGLPAFDIVYTNSRIERPVMSNHMAQTLQMKILSVVMGLDPGESESDEG